MADCETCCGFGGAFSVKFGDISAKMADGKCEHVQQMVQQQGASAVVLGDLGCMLNIEGRLRARGDTRTAVLHWAEVLAGQQGVVSESVSEALSESTSGRASEPEG
jgi:L-lactate dehydrogenase complex protein LldE